MAFGALEFNYGEIFGVDESAGYPNYYVISTTDTAIAMTIGGDSITRPNTLPVPTNCINCAAPLSIQAACVYCGTAN